MIKNCDCKARILVVDDTDFNVLAVKLMIKENFMLDIEEAPNGKIGYEMFKEGFDKPCGCEDRAYKLVFMDIQMPIMGGVESGTLINNLIKSDLEAQKAKKKLVRSNVASLRGQESMM